MYYSSRYKDYKSVFGAVKQHYPISYRVYAPNACAVNMMIKLGAEGSYISYPMSKGENGWFFNDTSFEKTGVYFYHFEAIYDRHKQGIFRAADMSDSAVSKADWQQTVYAKDFCVPKSIFGGIIYQIFPDRFFKAPIEYQKSYSDRVNAEWDDRPLYKNGTIGAVINNDYFGGNFRGIIEKLPYLKSLCISAIYLNPIFEAHSNHRYNTADYMRCDPLLGTNDDFALLCKKAKEYGIDIILDGVFSHTGADSIYFNKNGRYDSVGAYQSQSSPYYSWYKFQHFPDKYTSWWGFETLPEVNETNNDYSDFITGKDGVIDYWMKLGASGFRLDVADELPDEFIVKIRNAVKRNDGILYGEVWEDASNKLSYGKQRQFLMGNELDSVMNYPFSNLITAFVKGGSGVDFIDGVMSLLENYPKESANSLMNLLSTHDTERILTALAGEPTLGRGREWQATAEMSEAEVAVGIRMLKMASLLQYTLPGVPSIYYGDEIGTSGYRDPFNRTSFKWEKATESNTLLCWHRMLGLLRSRCPALKEGSFIPVQYEAGYISFIRACEDAELFVIANPSETPAEIWLLPGWRNDKTLIGNQNVNGILTVEPKTVAVMGRGEWCKELDFTDYQVKKV